LDPPRAPFATFFIDIHLRFLLSSFFCKVKEKTKSVKRKAPSEEEEEEEAAEAAAEAAAARV